MDKHNNQQQGYNQSCTEQWFFSGAEYKSNIWCSSNSNVENLTVRLALCSSSNYVLILASANTVDIFVQNLKISNPQKYLLARYYILHTHVKEQKPWFSRTNYDSSTLDTSVSLLASKRTAVCNYLLHIHPSAFFKVGRVVMTTANSTARIIVLLEKYFLQNVNSVPYLVTPIKTVVDSTDW